jgi:methylenetetrahydrofolate reductase (NADPH)
MASLIEGYSIEVTPTSLQKLPVLEGVLPSGTRVYIAHLDGTSIGEMIAAATRLSEAGYRVMPHLPARSVPDARALTDWLTRYRDEAGVHEALLLAGGRSSALGSFTDSMQLVETGLFDRLGFDHLHFAGHPEGNRDIDPDGGSTRLDAALAWKQAFQQRSDASVALVTQFVFDAAPVIDWSRRLAQAEIDLPIYVGLAGPTKLQTLIRYAIACGVGGSLKVLQKRALDLTRLLRPYAPDPVASALADHVQTETGSRIAGVHMFPFGGVAACAQWCAQVSRNS